jgi:hypothetical protein
MDYAMTMLYSLYSAEGIIFAADSQVTGPGELKPRRPQTKVLRIPGLGVADEGGVIGFFGLAQVGGVQMSDWLRAAIARRPRQTHVHDFCDYLINEIHCTATAEELKCASGFHIGAFEIAESAVVPVFYFVRNCFSISDDGVYADIRDYKYEEQLVNRYRAANLPIPQMRSWLRDFQSSHGYPFWYRNGDLPHFTYITSSLKSAIERLVSKRGSAFQSPSTLQQWQQLARTLVVTSSNLYRIYYRHTPPLVGQKPIVETIGWPTRAASKIRL